MSETKPKKLSPHQRAIAHPTSMAKAIKAKCWDCQGRGADPGWQAAVRQCTVSLCPLWHVRPYRTRSRAREAPRTTSHETNTP